MADFVIKKIDTLFTESTFDKLVSQRIMSPIAFQNAIKAVILDIEGTVAPISFVKETLFPYFLKEVPSILSKLQYPISETSNDPISQIVSKFSSEYTQSENSLLDHIISLVKKDIKDSTLKSLQGYIWQKGYEDGALKAPVYDDAIKAIKEWSSQKKVYIYSSGSVKAQKLLFGYVDVQGESVDLNGYLSGYFDITTSGFKYEKTSYEAITRDIDIPANNLLFLSDNVAEVSAAIDAGLNSAVVIRRGNVELTSDERATYKLVHTFDELQI